MVMGDVDWFKHYNDRNGHEAGNDCFRSWLSLCASPFEKRFNLPLWPRRVSVHFWKEKLVDEACQLTRQNQKKY
jgi:hypothetical protein